MANHEPRRLIGRIAPAILVLGMILAGAPVVAQAAETIPLTIHHRDGSLALSVEVASTPAARRHGLMERDHLAEEGGMLFLYPTPQPVASGFWMYRTRIPLDIAFLDETGRILSLHRMEPCPSTLPRECPVTYPEAPYRAALEVNAGLFAAHGVAVGDCVDWGSGSPCRPAP